MQQNGAEAIDYARNRADAVDTFGKTVLVLGGDGFCGWPTALHLSDLGYSVVIVDNLSRRKIDLELECESLTPIAAPSERIRVWNSLSGREIRFEFMDVAHEYWHLLELIKREQPCAIVHFAEQRAAPYSMKGSRQKRYTIDNNVNGTMSVLTAVVESELDIHVVHLGTMGVYGYGSSGGKIPEGYLDVVLPSGERRSILHPAYPGSVYHASKCLDALLFQFFARNDGLRITDLHQGVVWGTFTKNTMRHEVLMNRYDYDSDYGTVLNRFLMQAACGLPLTVYGTGGQTRAFIHISDTCKCIALALANPPNRGERVKIYNQVAETHRVRDLAALVARKTGARVQQVPNPRNEAAENELDVSNQNFRSLGWDPVTLEESLLEEVVGVAEKYRHRIRRDKVMPSSFWNREREEACRAGESAEEVHTDHHQINSSPEWREQVLWQLANGDDKKLERIRTALRDEP
jgi:UDP-sulfoquinovose synthase